MQFFHGGCVSVFWKRTTLVFLDVVLHKLWDGEDGTLWNVWCFWTTLLEFERWPTSLGRNTVCSVQRVNSVFVCVRTRQTGLLWNGISLYTSILFSIPVYVIAKAMSFVIAHAICWMGLICLLRSSHYICYLCSISHQGWVGRLLSKCHLLVTSYLSNCNQ